jgi:tetratricopeptide (TPR) repeat protein
MEKPFPEMIDTQASPEPTYEVGRWGKIFLIFFITFLVYFNSIFNPFIWDDFQLILDNPYIRSFKNFKFYFTTDLFRGGTSNFYRPLQTISYAIIYKIFKLNPVGYHLLNIFLHTGCAILIFILLRDIYGEKISFFGSLLWAIHPVNTEAITYISGTADPLFLFFGLLGIYFYNKNFKILSYFSFIISLLSKETSVLILPIFFLYQYCSYRLNKNQIKNYIIITLIFLIYFILRQTILNFGKAVPEDIFLHRFYTSFKSFLIYISILLFPFILSMERHIPYIKTFKDIDFIAGFIFFLAFLYFLWRKRDDRKILFGGTLFLINFIFHSNTIIPLNGNLREHWMYLGSTGFFIYFIILLEKIKKEKLKIALTIIIFSLYGVRTILRNYDWNSPIKFYEKSIDYGFRNKKIYYNLAHSYLGKGEYEKALEIFKIAEPLYKNKKLVYLGISACLYNLGKYKEAEEYCKKILKIDPYDPFSLTTLATIYYNNKEKPLSETINLLKICIEKNPAYREAYILLGRIFYENGNFKESAKCFKISVFMNPEDDVSNLLLGMSYFNLNDMKNAEIYLKRAYQLKPNKIENILNLAFFYKLTGKFKEAIEIYGKALDLKPDDLDTLNDIGLCYAMTGNKEKAKEIWEGILKKNPDYKLARENLKILLGR